MDVIELVEALKTADGETAMELVELLQCGRVNCSALSANGGEAVPYGYLREVDGNVQLSVGPECPPNRSGGIATPWAPIFDRPAQPSVAVPEFLLEMSEQMREQPNRMTAHPFWQVRCNRYLPTLEGYSQHHIEIYGNDGVVYRSDQPLSELHEYLIENHQEWCRQWSEENHEDQDSWQEAIEFYFDLDCDDLPEELSKIPVQEIEEVVSTHLTQAGAERFIKRKQHDYPKLFTYVESAYWSPQLRELQDWIISLTAAPAPDHADAGKMVPDSDFSDEFAKWWEDHGQFVRAGGGNYERTFAFEAWRHLYPRIATPSVPEEKTVIADDLELWLSQVRRMEGMSAIDIIESAEDYIDSLRTAAQLLENKK